VPLVRSGVTDQAMRLTSAPKSRSTELERRRSVGVQGESGSGGHNAARVRHEGSRMSQVSWVRRVSVPLSRSSRSRHSVLNSWLLPCVRGEVLCGSRASSGARRSESAEVLALSGAHARLEGAPGANKVRKRWVAPVGGGSRTIGVWARGGERTGSRDMLPHRTLAGLVALIVPEGAR